MKSIRLAGFALGFCGLAWSSASAADWTVAASGGADFTTIKAAAESASVNSGDRILITEASTYSTTSITLQSNKSLTFEASVGGVIAQQTAGSWGLSSGPSAPITLTFKNFIIERTLGTGAAMDIAQSSTVGNTLGLTFENMTVRHVLAGSGGEAIRLVGVASGQTVTVNATGTVLSSAATSAKSAFRVQTAGDNLNITLTGCTISNQGTTGTSLPAIQSDGGSNQIWNVSSTSITSATDRGFRQNTAHSNCSFTFTGCSITSALEGISMSSLAGGSNTWNIQRCTIDASAGLSRALRVEYTTALNSNSLTVHNSVIKAAATSSRAISGTFLSTGTYHHNTLVGVGNATSGTSIGISMSSSNAYDFSNNLILNFADPVSGTTGTKTKNVVCGPADDSSAGGDRQYFNVSSTASSPGDMLSTIGVDASFKPTSNSSALAGTGDTSSTIATAVGNVDRDNNSRPNPGATPPDVGAYETAFLPVELDAFSIN